MTLSVKIVVYEFFGDFWAAKHILRANCAEIITDRPV